MEQQVQSAGGCRPLVVLAVDKSKHSEYAFDYYIKNSHKPCNNLHVITVTEGWPSVHPMDGGPSPAHVRELKAKDEVALNELQAKYTKLMADNQIEGEFHAVPCTSKHIWDAIVTYQENHGGIMIVIGTRGLGSFRRTVMGSVSDGVVHHAHCPVLVCRHDCQ